jgi:2Fe-2S ferredoxin
MPQLTFVEDNGTRHPIEAPLGRSLMQIALDHSVPGMLGECGGSCSCGTCHGVVDVAWMPRLPAMNETEVFMLEGIPERRDGSRLCCQIRMQAELDGLVVQLPREQI